LCWLVCAASDERVAVEVTRLLASIQIDWQQFIVEAESNGLAPWLYHNRDNGRIQFDAGVLNKLRALSVRHQHASEVYTEVLIELLTAFAEKEIDVILLKGAALARTVYPQPGLRPMRDLDILVHIEDLTSSWEVCQGLGFCSESALLPSAMSVAHHHHLPALERQLEGLTVSLEIHEDALARDTFRCLNGSCLASKPQYFFLADDLKAQMLGPIDMLNHLTQHAFEPGSKLKLVQAVDLSRYLLTYGETIPWSAIHGQYPQIIHRLQWIDTVCPLPQGSHTQFAEPVVLPDRDSGILMATLSSILRRGVRIDKILGGLFRPPSWWLYGYYGYSAKTPLFYLLWIVHPWRVCRWLIRRIWIKLFSNKVVYGNSS